LTRIPSKARSLLGISGAARVEVSESVLRAHEVALVRRLRVLRPPVNVVGRHVLEAIRGGSWDEEVWRCLRVLVGVVERSGPGGGGVELGVVGW
jgi:hypothetical protein